MEHVDGLHLLTCTYELNRFGYNRTDREGSTTTGITIKFGQNDTVEVKTIIEFLCRIDCILTRHRVNHEEGLIGINSILQAFNLLHHLLVDCQTTSGIDDHHIIRLGLSLLNGVVGNLNHIFIVRL